MRDPRVFFRFLTVCGLLGGYALLPARAHAAADPSTVLILVNDAWPAEPGTGGTGASVYIGQHYAAVRGIPTSQILHLNIPLSAMQSGPTPGTYDFIYYADYLTTMQNPIKAFLESNGLKNKILYIVPTRGIPYMFEDFGGASGLWRISVDSVLAGMYSGSTFVYQYGGQLNPYFNASATSSPLHFKDWVNPAGWKMYLVSRLDGPSAMIAAALPDKAIAAESTIQKTSGKAYFDYQHDDNSTDKYGIDHSILLAYNEAVTLGIPAVFNDQTVTGEMLQSAPNSSWVWGWYGPIISDTYPSPVLGSVGTQMTSYTANYIRNGGVPGTDSNWCAYFLNKGITATWGATGEPYVTGYAYGDSLLGHFWRGYTFGESAYLSSPELNWMMVFIGDPLYAPTAFAPTSGGALAVEAFASPNPVTGTQTGLSETVTGGTPPYTYQWAGPTGATFNASDATPTVTFAFASQSQFALTVTDSKGQSATATLQVPVVATLTTLKINGASSASINQQVSFQAVGFDQFGNARADGPSARWATDAGAMITASGVFSASVAGTHAVTAAVEGISTTVTITVSGGTPTVLTVSGLSSTPSPVTGTSATLAASVIGGAPPYRYQWSQSAGTTLNSAVASPVVTFSRVGIFQFTLSVSDSQNATASGELQVSVPPTLSALSILGPTFPSTGQSVTYSAAGVDQFGNAMSSSPSVLWTTDTGATIDAQGVFVGSTAGPHRITATTPGGVTGGLQGLSQSITVTVTAALGTLAVSNVAATPNPVAGKTSILSSTVSGGVAPYRYQWNQPAGAALDPSAASPSVTFSRAGFYPMTLTVIDAQGQTASASVQVTVAQTLTSMTVEGPLSLSIGQLGTFIATGFDQFGAGIASPPSPTWGTDSGATINAQGGFSASVAGTHRVTATAGAITQSTTVNVLPPTLSVSAVSSMPNPVTGVSSVLSATVNGGVAPYHYQWTVPANATLDATAVSPPVTFTQAGSYAITLTVTDAQGQTAKGSVTFTVGQTLSALTLAGPTTVILSRPYQYTVAGVDQFRQALSSPPTVLWSTDSGATISASGQLVATTTGPHRITATSGAVSQSITVTASNAALVVSEVVAIPNPVTGHQTILSAQVSGGVGTVGYVWSEPANTTLSVHDQNPSVTFDRAGPYTFNLTVTDSQNHTATSSVLVNVRQTLSSLTVDGPSSASANQSVTYTASGLDQFGEAMTSAPPVTWTADHGATIDAQGHFVAASAGVYHVTATDGGLSQSMTIAVTAGVSPLVVQAVSASPNPAMKLSTVLSAQVTGGVAPYVYLWSEPENTTLATHSPSPTVSFSQSGIYSFTLTVTDSQKRRATGEVTVTATADLSWPLLSLDFLDAMNDTLPITGLITLHYNPGSAHPGAQYAWTITPDESAIQSVLSASAPPSTAKTPSPVLGLSQWTLVPGVYTLTVQAADATSQSNMAAKKITLVSAGGGSMIVAPNPWRADNPRASFGIVFSSMPAASTLKIFAVNGQWVKTLDGSTGTARWNVQNENGRTVASGIYLYLVTDDRGDKLRGKFVIIR